MAKKPGSIPKFGDWKDNSQAGGEYTMFFDTARNRRTGGGPSPYNQFNPNDPQQNQKIFKEAPPQARREERREEKRGEDIRYRSRTPPPKGGIQDYGQQKEEGAYRSRTPPPRGSRPPPAGIQGYGQQRNERDTVLPAFGAWDERDASSADNFTGTFEKVSRQTRRERGEDVPTSFAAPSPNHHYATHKEKRHHRHCTIL